MRIHPPARSSTHREKQFIDHSITLLGCSWLGVNWLVSQTIS
jgi:hypothetical protein